MRRFSERLGITPVRSKLQVGSMDDALRNGLWNALTVFPFPHTLSSDADVAITRALFRSLWFDFFKQPYDQIETYTWIGKRNEIRRCFFIFDWNEVYDFIEFVVNSLHPGRCSEMLKSRCNAVLESEMSGYRFVGTAIVKIDSEVEIAAIEKALDLTGPFTPAAAHIDASLAALADRKNPSYPDSIKEAILAVEATCRIIAGDPKATLGKALRTLEQELGPSLHPALRSAFDRLYGYTSDAEGIRHALLEEPTLQSEDARFMLIACSAFVNYLIAKASRAGMQFQDVTP